MTHCSIRPCVLFWKSHVSTGFVLLLDFNSNSVAFLLVLLYACVMSVVNVNTLDVPLTSRAIQIKSLRHWSMLAETFQWFALEGKMLTLKHTLNLPANTLTHCVSGEGESNPHSITCQILKFSIPKHSSDYYLFSVYCEYSILLYPVLQLIFVETDWENVFTHR